MDPEIQVQVELLGIKRVFVTANPQSYGELLSLIQVHITRVETGCLMYENDEGDYVMLSKEAHSLSVAIESSRRIPGVNSKRLKVKVLECISPTSPSPSNQSSADVDDTTHSFSTGMK